MEYVFNPTVASAWVELSPLLVASAVVGAAPQLGDNSDATYFRGGSSGSTVWTELPAPPYVPSATTFISFTMRVRATVGPEHSFVQAGLGHISGTGPPAFDTSNLSLIAAIASTAVPGVHDYEIPFYPGLESLIWPYIYPDGVDRLAFAVNAFTTDGSPVEFRVHEVEFVVVTDEPTPAIAGVDDGVRRRFVRGRP